MSRVVQSEGAIKKIVKDFFNRKSKKELLDTFEGDLVRVRIERIDEYDERIYG